MSKSAIIETPPLVINVGSVFIPSRVARVAQFAELYDGANGLRDWPATNAGPTRARIP